MIQLCAAIITYYPDIQEVTHNINQLLPSVDHLIIWENTPAKDNDKHSLREVFSNNENITFLTTGKNEGIAYPLNRAVEWAKANNYTHILTMDQDSTWVDFRRFRADVESLKDRFKIFAPNIIGYDTTELYKESYASITSGSIYDISIFEEIGVFTEKLFIDAIDSEFGWRAKIHGYNTCILTRHKMDHKLGYAVKGKYCESHGYSATRRYYITRNHIWFYRAYKQTFEPKHKRWVGGFIKEFVFKEPIKVILNENHKFSKCYASIKGVLHGLFYPHPFS